MSIRFKPTLFSNTLNNKIQLQVTKVLFYSIMQYYERRNRRSF